MCRHAPTTAADLTHKRRWPAEVQAAIDRFKRRFGDEVSGLAAEVADRYAAPGPSDVVTVVSSTVSERRERLTAILTDGMIDGAEAGRRMSSRRFDLDIDFDVVPQSTIDELEDVIDEAGDDIFATLGEGIQSDIESAIEAGDDVDTIAERLRSRSYADRLDRRHTQTHARTLVQGASERGNHSAMQEAPGVVGERWHYTSDGRARETHIEAGGQIAPVDGPFVVGGARLRHPGDPQAPIGEIANCRCYATPVFEDDLSEDELAQLRAGNRLNT